MKCKSNTITQKLHRLKGKKIKLMGNRFPIYAKNIHFKTLTYLSARVYLACERVFGRGVDSNKGLLSDEE